MIAVIFKAEPGKEGFNTCLEHAARLKLLLAEVDGFMSIERFQSLANPGKLLLLAFWRDEEAVRAWRGHAEHRNTQRVGREGVFDDYRLRVAAVVRDYGLVERDQAPPFHAPIKRKRESCPILPPGEF